MRIQSILRGGLFAVALTTSLAALAPAFADTLANSAQPGYQQDSSTGPYDGPSWEAAKQAQDSQQQ